MSPEDALTIHRFQGESQAMRSLSSALPCESGSSPATLYGRKPFSCLAGNDT
jgi:hypothetical protein